MDRNTIDMARYTQTYGRAYRPWITGEVFAEHRHTYLLAYAAMSWHLLHPLGDLFGSVFTNAGNNLLRWKLPDTLLERKVGLLHWNYASWAL